MEIVEMFFLGGMTVEGCGWIGQRGVYLDFVSQLASGWLWQLYANRTLIGRTTSPTQRRIVGQLLDVGSPAPLTLIRVDPPNVLTDHGPELPKMPWSRFGLQWSAASFPADADHFTITGSRSPGGSVDATNVIANVPYIGDGDYSVVLPSIDGAGVWSYAVTSRDNAKPQGNPGTIATVSVTAGVPPDDVTPDSRGRRFSLSVESSVVAADFDY